MDPVYTVWQCSSAAPCLDSVLFLILILPRHGLPGDQAEEGGQEERQARGDIHGNLQLLQLQMAHKPI